MLDELHQRSDATRDIIIANCHSLTCCATGSAACLLPQLQQQLRRNYAVVSGEDSHDDFKPKYKSEPASDVSSTIEKDIKGHEVFIYMKVSHQANTAAAAACQPGLALTLYLAIESEHASGCQHEQVSKRHSSSWSTC